MGHSSLLGIDEVPLEAPGRDDEALGPSESSDSASDRVGANDLAEADPNEAVDITLGRDVVHPPIEGSDSDAQVRAGADISVDRIFSPEDEEEEGIEEFEDNAAEPARSSTRRTP